MNHEGSSKFESYEIPVMESVSLTEFDEILALAACASEYTHCGSKYS